MVTVMSLLAGLADLIGGWLTLMFAFSRTRMEQLMALGAGFLLGGALFTMLPAALAESAGGPFYVAVGFLGLYVIRQVGSPASQAAGGPTAASAWAAFVGLLLHSFFDGAALGAAIQADQQLGLMAAVAIFLHKIPEGFSLAAVVLAATHSRRLAMMATGTVGLVTVLGAWTVTAWATVATVPHGAMLGLAAGSFLYVGSTEMLPPLLGKRHTVWLVLVGVLMLFLLTGMGSGHHGGHIH